MYKLTYFKAVNVIGFISGLGRKTFELDLAKFIDKEIIAILGDNATGKSTFMSLVHPVHIPTNNRSKFIVQGKEGLLLREYTGQDGTIISTKCVYSPSGESHNSKLFMKLIYPDGRESELNPSGNVTTYYSLLETYFGLTEDFVKFASYNDRMKGIVDMTASERKKNTTTLIPNTKRFDVAYNIINEKYKEVRNLIKNVSQKIVRIKDEVTLKAELKRLEDYLNNLTEERENLVKKNSKHEGRLKEIIGDSNPDDMVKEFKENNKLLTEIYNDMLKAQHKLETLTGITLEKDSDFDDIPDYTEKINNLKGKLTKLEVWIPETKMNLEKYKSELYSLEESLEEYTATLYSLQTNDLDDLEKVRKDYLDKVASLRYTKVRDKYKNLDYNECISFMSNLELILNVIFGIYEKNNQLFSDYLNKSGIFAEYSTEDEILKGLNKYKTSVVLSLSSLDELTNECMKMNSYRNLGEKLKLRPTNCEINDCPFIIDALKWPEIELMLNKFQIQIEALRKEMDNTNDKIEILYKALQTISDTNSLNQLLMANENLFKKYFNVTIEMIYNTLKRDGIPTYFNLDYLKEVAAILSEKDLYNDIMGEKLPDIERTIELVKNNEKNVEMLLKEKNKVSNKITIIKKEIDTLTRRDVIYGINKEKYTEKLEQYSQISVLIDSYKEFNKQYKTLKKEVSELSEKLNIVFELYDKIEENKKQIKKFEKDIDPALAERDRLKFELNQLLMLIIEKKQIEKDYTLLDLMRYIVQPGKGIWNIITDIYMYDINTIANQLLLNTFNGNLYLNDFIIDDKSFIIPYTYNGVSGADVSYASSSQQTAISTALSLAILSKLISKYGILTYDEVDKDMSPANKEVFVDILTKQIKFIGINQNWIITHNPEYYEAYDIGYLLFPGFNLKRQKDKDYIEV